ncbi:MAG: histidine kinase, partial [Saprospiraceae bacterium]|nr:histidine kinase [Saprospiraceae bacterium]
MSRYIEFILHVLFWLFVTWSYFQNALNDVRIVTAIADDHNNQDIPLDSAVVTVNYIGKESIMQKETITDSTILIPPEQRFSRDIMVSEYQKNDRIEWIRFYDRQIVILLSFGNIIKALLFYGVVFLLIPKWLAPRKWWIFIGLLILFISTAFGLEMLMNTIYLQYQGQVVYPDGVRPNNFRHLLNINLRLYPFFLGIAFTYRFAKDWIHNQYLQKKLTEEKLTTELKFLKAQVHPHFLFNTLNNLYGMALADKSERTAEGIAKLAQQMRYMLYESNEDFVTLDKEIAYIQTFINLQRLRITPEDNIIIKFEQDGETIHKQIAPMLLIPFVENAFKHSLTFKGKTEILINLKVLDNQLFFIVSNTINAQRSPHEESASGLGLQNVKRRLELLYPN